MKRGTPDHPKTAALMAYLLVPRYQAVGLLELLWHFTAKFAPQGDIGKWSDSAIASACSWSDDPTRFVAALTDAGWLDKSTRHRLIVHDWEEHTDDATKKALARKKLEFAKPDRTTADKVRQRRTTADNGGQNPPAVAGAVPLPEPSLAKPEPTIPPSPPALAKPPAEVVPVWNREAAEDWLAAKGGAAPGRIFPALKRAVQAHGWERVRPVWRYYLGSTPGEFVQVDKFVSIFGELEKRMQGGQSPGAKATPGNATLAAAARVIARHEGRRT